MEETASEGIEAFETSEASEAPRKEWLRCFLLALLPGLFAGFQLTGLLFFLNPHLPFRPEPFLRALVYYAAVLGLAGVVVQLSWARGIRTRAERALPWALVIVFVLAAAFDWVHASVFDFYLPPGINRRLIRAAMWLSLAGVVAFYTALLHSLHGRSYGLRSRLGLSLLVAGTIYATLERREAFRPPPPVSPRPSIVESIERPNVLVIGLEGATLDAVLPLAQQGQLPFFAQTLEQGAYGRLRTLRPTRRFPAWTTLATGRNPYEHGVVDDRSYRADFIAPGAELRLLPLGLGFRRWGVGPEVRRPSGATRRTLALWEICTRLGLETTVVGWPASAPLAAGPVAAYSDRFFQINAGPAGQAANLARRLTQLDPDTPVALRVALTRDLRRLQLTERLLPTADPESAQRAGFLVLPGLETVSHLYYGGYAAVQFNGAQGGDRLEASRHLASYYAHLDQLLSELWEDLPEPRQLWIVSAFGTHAKEGLASIFHRLSGGSALEGFRSGAPDGLFLLRGDGVRAGTFVPELELADIAPTLLYSLGLPLAQDLPGQLRTEVFDTAFLEQAPLVFVPSYETLALDPPPRARADSR